MGRLRGLCTKADAIYLPLFEIDNFAFSIYVFRFYFVMEGTILRFKAVIVFFKTLVFVRKASAIESSFC